MRFMTSLAIAAFAGLAFASPAKAQDTFISIGANPIGNTAYQWAAGIAELLNQKMEEVNVTAEGTKGYAANVRLLLDKQIEAGFANSKQAREAYLAEADYADAKPRQVLGWLAVAPIVQHVVVLENSDIRTLQDLKGKRVGIGQPGGTSMLDAEILMEAAGLVPGEDFNDFRVNLSEMTDMLADGQLDALVWNGSIPLPPIIKLQSQHKLRFIPISEDVSAAVREKYPAYTQGNLPANTYNDQPKEIPSYRLGNVLVIHADVPEEIVYKATKTIMENLDYLAGVHPVWKKVSKETILTGFSTPLHPGAVRYFRESGVPGIDEFVAETSK